MKLTKRNGYVSSFFFGLLFVLLGCEQPVTRTYTPRENITYEITVKKYEPKPEHKSVFMYFDLEIRNESQKMIYFNPAELKASLNGVGNEFVYYDSLASVMPEKKRLEKGTSSYRLYFTFKEDEVGQEPFEFVLKDFGLSEAR